ncbi:VOC family protein [Pelagibacterium xiamenense]|uniref:VOC family protein n=1 Tax=Pelagibacterium xiamenense TaxID=2901140 RepID=UPI001E31082C|nr:VOC family protein [Pelagibacterium xiamenense]MCD7059476.1 VOC family protein [Pelagibacterium xiamenense]
MSGLKGKNSSAMLAVSDIERAKKFYGGTLGLEAESREMGDVVIYKTGLTKLELYPSEFAGTNKANAVSFACGGDIQAVVDDLRANGVTFEKYDIEGASFEDGVHSWDGMLLAWFKDPDGNIILLHNS